MKKIILTFTILAMTFIGQAQASLYSDIMVVLLKTGVADKAVVVHNIGHYSKILNEIESVLNDSNASDDFKLSFVTKMSLHLRICLMSQMTIVGMNYSRDLAPEIIDALEEVEYLLEEGNYQGVRLMIKKARKEFLTILKAI